MSGTLGKLFIDNDLADKSKIVQDMGKYNKIVSKDS